MTVSSPTYLSRHSRMAKPDLSRHSRMAKPDRGFTLTEILMVIAIIGVLIAIAVPATSSYPQSKQLSSEGDNLSAQIAYCRLLAVSSAKPVEIRFYLQPVVKTMDDEYFRSTQVMTTDEEGRFQPDGRIQTFAGNVILSPNDEFSSILSGTPEDPDPNASDVGNRLARDLAYQAVRFLPDGSTNLGRGAGNHWTITLVLWTPNFQEGTLPADFVTLQIDPFTSKVRRYEPGQ